MTASPHATNADQGRLALASEFPAAELDQWRALVAGVLSKSGVDPAKVTGPIETALATETYDGITVRPLYTAEQDGSETGLPGLPPFVRGSRPEGGVLAGWDIRQAHINPDPAAANTAILADLEGGVSSIWLRVGASGVPVDRLAEALHGVYLDLAGVVLDAGADYLAAAEALFALRAERQVPASELSGALGADPISVHARGGLRQDLAPAAALAARVSAEFPKLRALLVDGEPYHDAGGSDAQELAYSIAAGVEYLRALTESGMDVDDAAGQLEFRYAASADQFLTIAKFRAARRLWARVTEVCGVSLPARAQRQHAVTSAAMMAKRDPWVNMLRETLACFAAGVGGADAITVRPFDSAIGLPDAFAMRIARNTQSILLEESKVAGVIDPAGGSWYVDQLTDELAHTAWSLFTEVERGGGLVTALESGQLADELAAVRQRREANLASRSDPLTGVSEFANLAEEPLVRDPLPAPRETGGLPVIRYPERFELLRDRADRHHGGRPTVFLATLGSLAEHTARVSFATNLLQAGGIDTVTGTIAEFAESGAPVACICGPDSAYADGAAELAGALREQGARRVLLAGKPKDYPGVDAYVFAGCEALSTLSETLDALGVDQ
ncbi:heterodimeric methylmalonyl-CoA mutase small subunit [Tamaricihabitans halophyticus]|uniref:Heterodimeric methylmalonyl-CoA mutase small subunit n=1 Tax=Tamaricihabitans halophyticus TaxID=1262583 RepID=A0A4R2R140_9PSEU|nr:methylmalonyl-CoA mutase family protein [Tamaricihabitans halophyticus]TCP56203.1 heterodimeric methylmalonyl-CoA mutase small subunit [Tamaricihabitans halophyticus]